MRLRTIVRVVVWGGTALLAAAVLWLRGCGQPRRLSAISLPRGFSIALYADSVPDARSLALGDRGTVFVGSRGAGTVYALSDTNRDGRADEVIPLLRGLDTPNGVAFRNGALYVALVSRILRYDSIEQRLRNPPPPVVITDRLPTEAHHGWRYIGVGPDAWLYVASGAPCNICTPPGEQFAAILRMRPRTGAQPQVFARGVRNSVGFDWHPRTHELWFTDNGRDWLGPDEPPDELNRAPVIGLHFGFPFCHGGTTLDPEFGKGRRCADYVPPSAASALTSRRWACDSTRGRCSRWSIAVRYSPNTDPGTESSPWATGSRSCGWKTAGRSPMPRLRKVGCAAARAGDGPWTCWSCPMGPCSSRMTRRA